MSKEYTSYKFWDRSSGILCPDLIKGSALELDAANKIRDVCAPAFAHYMSCARNANTELSNTYQKLYHLFICSEDAKYWIYFRNNHYCNVPHLVKFVESLYAENFDTKLSILVDIINDTTEIKRPEFSIKDVETENCIYFFHYDKFDDKNLYNGFKTIEEANLYLDSKTDEELIDYKIICICFGTDKTDEFLTYFDGGECNDWYE